MATKIPETDDSLEALKVLLAKKKANESTVLDYCLSSQVNATCEVDAENDKVGLWLGANVMVLYSYEEAFELLSTNVKKGKERIKKLDEELAFIKTQITTTEVTLARVYNHDVIIRREASKEK